MQLHRGGHESFIMLYETSDYFNFSLYGGECRVYLAISEFVIAAVDHKKHLMMDISEY